MAQNTPINQQAKPAGARSPSHWPTVLRGGYLSLLLLLPSFWALAEPDTSDLNRRLREFPEWRLGKHLQPSFHAEIGVALADRLGARRLARRGSAELSRWLGDSPSSSVVAGRGGWLFLEESLRLMTQADNEPIRRRRAVNALQTRVIASGRTFRMVVAPNKATLYPDRLRAEDQRRWQALAEPKIERFGRIMASRPVAGFVGIGEELKAKAARTESLLHEPLGSHWVDDGALEAARILVQSLASDLWERAVVEVEGEEEIASDLLSMAGLEGEGLFPRWQIHLPGYRTRESYKEWTEPGLVRVLSTVLSPSVLEAELISGATSPPALLPPLVLIHDSFGARLGDLLAPFFEHLAMLNYDAAWSPTAKRMVAESQIVVFEMAERYFFLASGAKPTHDWPAVRALLEGAGTAPVDWAPFEASAVGLRD